jgi:hypothetical protein
MRQALRASGRKTKRAVVDEALRLLVRTNAQLGVRRLRALALRELRQFEVFDTGGLDLSDRGFDPFERHLGLTVVHPSAE